MGMIEVKPLGSWMHDLGYVLKDGMNLNLVKGGLTKAEAERTLEELFEQGVLRRV